MKKIVVVFVVLCLAGCKTKYVTVEKVQRDTVYHSTLQRDSVMVLDSVFVNVLQRGDTVFSYLTKWRVQYRDRWRTDTLYQEHVDSIPIPYPVEKELSKWEKFCVDYGKVTVGGSVAALLLAGIMVYFKLKK